MSPVSRHIDHVVVAVHDLDAAAAFHRRLGFQVGGRNRHPWGTENRLIQFASSFIELITIGDDPAAIPPHEGHHFSFGAFVRDYLRDRQGLAMLALSSADAKGDAALFAARGIGAFEPFFFERKGRRPDGSETYVAFSLAFAADAGLPASSFFVCQQHFPQNFWNPDFQRHPNGATDIGAVSLAAPKPEAFGEFLAAFTGCSLQDGPNEVLSFVLGNDARLDAVRRGGPSGLASFMVRATDRARVDRVLRESDISFSEEGPRIAVPSQSAFGVELVFESERRERA